jgi:hypothetical protein
MKTVIEMAREAGIRSPDGYKLTVSHMSIDTLKAFEAIVRADEREQAAAQPAPVSLTDDQIRGLTPKPDGVAEGNVRRVEVLPGVMGTEFDEVDAWSMPLVLQIARAIEAKLKELNT